MNYREIKQDIFQLNPDEYYFAQCISADLAMGAGIATQFNKHFNTKGVILKKYDKEIFLELWKDTGGSCIPCGKVFLLITKEKYYNKPTLQSMRNALGVLKTWTTVMDCKKLAMPKIGGGLDKLKWGDVKELIFKVFEDTDVDITVCYLGDET